MGLMNLVVHGDMLLDNTRNEALAQAINETVRPGDVVADVGAGTGLLSMLAARAGASHVYAIERGPMVNLARIIVRRNGFEDVVEVVESDARDFAPDHPVDVVLCETLGMACLDEGFRHVVANARDRLLRPGGRLVPAEVDVLVAPVRRSAAAAVNTLDELDEILDLDLSVFGELVRRAHRRVHLGDDALLAKPQTAFRLDCAAMSPVDELATVLAFKVEVPGELGGFALWFEASLSRSVILSNWGADPKNHWGQALLTVRPCAVKADSVLALSVSIDDRPGMFRIAWQLDRGPEMEVQRW